MTGKELYEKYKGRRVKFGGMTGIVCGYNELAADADANDAYYILIAAMIDGMGWQLDDDIDIIVTHQNNELGYRYVEEDDVLPEGDA